MKSFKCWLALGALFCCGIANAGPYPSGTSPHSHQGPSSGGVLANPGVTFLSVTTTVTAPTANFGTLTSSVSATIGGAVNVTGVFFSSSVYQGKNRVTNGSFLYDTILGGTPNECSGVSCSYSDRIADDWYAYISSQPSVAIHYHVGSTSLLTQDSWINVDSPTKVGKLFPRALGLFYDFSQGTAVYPNTATRFSHQIDTQRWDDLQFGTAFASTVTVSFWQYTETGGTMCGSLQNGARTRSYPFCWSPADIGWEYFTVTIPGDTGGTWSSSDGTSAWLNFSGFQVGLNYRGSTNTWSNGEFYGGTVTVSGFNQAPLAITGIQIEKGSSATFFEQKSVRGTGISLNAPLLGETAPITTTPSGVRVSSSGIVAIKGDTTGANAQSGDYGEFISSTTAAEIPSTGSNQYFNVVSLTLTPGDWDISCMEVFNPNGATLTDAIIFCGSTASGDNTTGVVAGENFAHTTFSSTQEFQGAIPRYRMKVTENTQIWMKARMTHTVATPRARGTMSARRAR